MARGDEENDDEIISLFEEYSLSDQEEAYAELLEKHDNIRKENKCLKKKMNSMAHDNSLNDKNAYLELQVFELKKALKDYAYEKQIFSDLKIENENLLNSIDDLKLNVQKNQEAMVIVTKNMIVLEM